MYCIKVELSDDADADGDDDGHGFGWGCGCGCVGKSGTPTNAHQSF